MIQNWKLIFLAPYLLHVLGVGSCDLNGVYTEENIVAQNLSLKPNKLGAPKAQLFTSRHQPGLKPPPNVGAKKSYTSTVFLRQMFPPFLFSQDFFILQPHLAQTKNLFWPKRSRWDEKFFFLTRAKSKKQLFLMMRFHSKIFCIREIFFSS